jgi:hypothetical protein
MSHVPFSALQHNYAGRTQSDDSVPVPSIPKSESHICLPILRSTIHTCCPLPPSPVVGHARAMRLFLLGVICTSTPSYEQMEGSTSNTIQVVVSVPSTVSTSLRIGQERRSLPSTQYRTTRNSPFRLHTLTQRRYDLLSNMYRLGRAGGRMCSADPISAAKRKLLLYQRNIITL